jgi:hypothetical protein
VFSSTEVTRHDDHNIEVKSAYEFEGRALHSSLNLYLFVPRSFQLASWELSEVIDDFRTRIRLSVPSLVERSRSALEQAKAELAKTLNQISLAADGRESLHDLSSPLNEAIIERSKELAGVMHALFKTQSQVQDALIAETFDRAGSNQAEELFTQLQSAVETTSSALTSLRRMIGEDCFQNVQVLKLMDEYLSHLYVKNLSGIWAEIRRHRSPPKRSRYDSYWRGRSRFESYLSELQQKEALHHSTIGHTIEMERSVANREKHLMRLSHLKKFFQSKMFVEVNRTNPVERFAETYALMGALFGGLVAVVLQMYFARSHNASAQDLTSGGILVVTLAVMLYVVRDRLKDWVRSSFTNRAKKFLPSFSQQLQVDGKSIGLIKEWFQIYEGTTPLPAFVKKLRSTASQSELESQLQEDVIGYKQRQSVRAWEKGGSKRKPVCALQHNIRINLERYLKHMDDPFKDLTILDTEGKLTSMRGHRVYFFYLLVLTHHDASRSLSVSDTSGPWDSEFPNCQKQMFRVVLDKNGVTRVEPLRLTPNPTL